MDRQTETDTDARNYQFGAFLAQGIVARSEGSHEGSFRKFGLVGLHFGRGKGIVGFYDTRRMDAVGSDVQVAGGQQVSGFQYGIFTVHVQGSLYDAEILAGLFPDLQTLRFLASVVVVVRRTPEIRLDTEAFVEVFGSFDLVGSDDTAFLIARLDRLLRRCGLPVQSADGTAHVPAHSLSVPMAPVQP